jgi:glutaredoxin
MYTLYTKDNCLYCTKAKNLLTNKRLPFHVIEIGKDMEVETVREMFPDVRTVPVITKEVDGKHLLVGGFIELEKLLWE